MDSKDEQTRIAPSRADAGPQEAEFEQLPLEQTVALARPVATDATRLAPTRSRQAAQQQTRRVQLKADLTVGSPRSAAGTVPSHAATRVTQPVQNNVAHVSAQKSNTRTLKKRFELLELLGAGGMGNVYLAKDLRREEMDDSNPLIAIKVLNDECRSMVGALQSLQREAKKAQALSHPNIVTVYDFDRDGDTAFITMEYIKGQELKQRLRSKPMSHAQALFVVERVARGLAYAHQQGFAHSDIKPANIFLGENDTVKILDFGIAKAFTEANKEKRSAADDLTEGALTPAYASLEMLQGDGAVAADDVYSLSCMAYEMLSGRHPFIGTDGMPLPADAAKAKALKVEPIPGVSTRHMKALRKGLAFERSQRFADAGEFIDAIKPRNWKRDALMLTAAMLLAGSGFFALDFGLQQVVPSVDSLQPALAEVADLIVDGDEFLAAGDLSTANRLYAQAWDEANFITSADNAERKKVHAILRDRMHKLSVALIELSQRQEMDEYQLRELFIALEFLLRGEQTGNDKDIQQALANIERRIAQLESHTQ